VDKFTHVRFEPSGFTGNPQIPIAKSIVDYVFRWMALQFLPQDEQPRAAARERPRLAISRDGRRPARPRPRARPASATSTSARPTRRRATSAARS
jgi:ribonucleoside-diphosphate reductase alpha chain